MYKVLPFGLKDSPWVFSRVVATVIAHLRLQGIRIYYYLDDWLLVAESQSLLQSHLHATLQLAQSLGFIFNLKKSLLTPQRMPVYLGASLDIPRLIARPVERRVVALQSLIQELIASPTVPALTVAESSRPFGQIRGSDSKLQASHAASSVALPSILLPPVGLSVETDSADSRNQGSMCSLDISGSASRREAFLPPHSLHCSSDLRCLPVRLGRNSLRLTGFPALGPRRSPWSISTLSRTQGSVSGPEISRSSCHRSVSSDSFGQHNSRVLYQLPGRNSPSLCLLAIELWEWCIQRGHHLFGRSHSGGGQLGSRLPILLAGHPRVLPLQKNLFYQPMSRPPHPRLESLNLTLWPLSGRKESRRAFLLELQSSQRKLLGSQHELLTIPSWNAFSSGVTTSLVTPILPL